MKQGFGIILATALCIATATSSPLAHHNHQAYYDFCGIVTIEGSVDSFQFTDPHARIVLRLDDGTALTVDWMTPNNLSRGMILEPARKALAPGARVTVEGAPIRTAAEIRGTLPDFTRAVNPRTIDATLIRAGDGFSWSRPPQPPNSEICTGTPERGALRIGK